MVPQGTQNTRDMLSEHPLSLSVLTLPLNPPCKACPAASTDPVLITPLPVRAFGCTCWV